MALAVCMSLNDFQNLLLIFVYILIITERKCRQCAVCNRFKWQAAARNSWHFYWCLSCWLYNTCCCSTTPFSHQTIWCGAALQLVTSVAGERGPCCTRVYHWEESRKQGEDNYKMTKIVIVVLVDHRMTEREKQLSACQSANHNGCFLID